MLLKPSRLQVSVIRPGAGLIAGMLTLAALSLPGVLSAQDTPSGVDTVLRETPPTSTVGGLDEENAFRHPAESLTPYPVGHGDELTIKSLDYPEVDTVAIVDAQGEITFPLLGAVKVGGLSAQEIDALLTERLGSRFFYNPEITVEVSGFQSRKVYLLGHIENTGPYFLRTTTHVLDLLAMAKIKDSTADLYADKQLMLIRRMGDVPEGDGEDASLSSLPSNVKTLSMNLKRLFLSNNGSYNVELQHGDVIFVSDVKDYYIVGEVRSPGTYSLRENLTVLEAISKAGGFTSSASKSVRITRTVEGEQHKIKAKMDDLVQPGDVIEARLSLF